MYENVWKCGKIWETMENYGTPIFGHGRWWYGLPKLLPIKHAMVYLRLASPPTRWQPEHQRQETRLTHNLGIESQWVTLFFEEVSLKFSQAQSDWFWKALFLIVESWKTCGQSAMAVTSMVEITIFVAWCLCFIPSWWFRIPQDIIFWVGWLDKALSSSINLISSWVSWV